MPRPWTLNASALTDAVTVNIAATNVTLGRHGSQSRQFLADNAGMD
jgi:hypothetical protein